MTTGTLPIAAFVMASTAVFLIAQLLGGRKGRLERRLQDLPGRPDAAKGSALEAVSRSALPKVGAAFLPEEGKARHQLKGRLIQAGLYKRNAMLVFTGMKVLLSVAPVILGFFLGSMGLMPISYGVLFGAISGLFGTILPSFWLDSQKKQRQVRMRRSLPDALDVIIVCIEGGLSLPASFARVGRELGSAHPLLATEFKIVDREIQMGQSTGEALRHLADRFDVEELRSLASVVIQAERFGVSVTKALRVHADALRLKRQQRAEEMAHKAATKMLFPTVLLILPVMFIVCLGPAVFQILEVFANLGRR